MAGGKIELVIPRGSTTKKTKKRRKRRFRPVNIGVKRSPLPRQFKTTLRYVDQIVLNPTTGVNATYVFSANGLQDPNITGGGHGLRGWTQLIPLFEHATCIGSRILVQACNRDTTYPQMVGVSLRAKPDVETSLNDYVEQSNVSYKMLPISGGPKDSVTYNFNSKFLGLKPMDDVLRSTASANPTEQAYFHLFGASIPGIDSAEIDCLVTIEYIVVFTEPKDVAQS